MVPVAFVAALSLALILIALDARRITHPRYKQEAQHGQVDA